MDNPLRALFRSAHDHKPHKQGYTLPLQNVAEMYGLMNGRFNQKPNYWPSVFTPLKGNFWSIRGHTLAYFTDMKQKVYLKGNPLDKDFDPETAHTYPASPGVLYSEHYKRFKKKTFGLVIQQRIPVNSQGLHDRKLLDKHPPAFGLEGVRTDIDPATDTFHVLKMILPVFDKGIPVGAVTRNAAEMSDEEVERALLYGQLCVYELMKKRTLSVKNNWDEAQAIDLKEYLPKWKRPPAPVAVPA